MLHAKIQGFLNVGLCVGDSVRDVCFVCLIRTSQYPGMALVGGGAVLVRFDQAAC